MIFVGFEKSSGLTTFIAYLPLLIGAGTIIWLGWRGKTVWSAPYCRRCGYDLRGINPSDTTTCPECGAALREKHAVLFTRMRGRRWGLVAWGVAVLLMPLVFSLGAWLFQSLQFRINPSTPVAWHQLSKLNTDDLIRYQLPSQFDEPEVWNQLETRLKAGELLPGQADDAIQALAREMLTRYPMGWDEPLLWSRDFLNDAWSAGLLSDAVMHEFYEAYYGPTPKLYPPSRLRVAEQDLRLDLTYGHIWGNWQGDVPHELRWAVTGAAINGQAVPLNRSNMFFDYWADHIATDLPEGDHLVEVTVESILIDTSNLAGSVPEFLPRENWPDAPLRRWSTTVSQPLTVYPNEFTLVQPHIDPALRAEVAAAIKIKRIGVTARNGKTQLVIDIEKVAKLPIPVSADIEIQLGDETIRHSYMATGPSAGKVGMRRGETSLVLDDLDPSISEARVTLLPNPKHIESWPGVDQIWGEPIVFEDVPLVRMDNRAGPTSD